MSETLLCLRFNKAATMQIRFYQDTDFSEAVNIFVALSAYYLGEDGSKAPAVEDNLRNNILSPDSGVKLVLAFENGVAIGFASISILYPAPKGTGQMFVKELFVTQQHQSSGVGKEIMTFVAKYAKSNNCSRLDLTVDSDNTNAINFYQRLGILQLPTKLYFRAEADALNNLAKSTSG